MIGFHFVGPNAGEITQGFGLAVRLGAKKSDFNKLVSIFSLSFPPPPLPVSSHLSTNFRLIRISARYILPYFVCVFWKEVGSSANELCKIRYITPTNAI